jgi:hypothetical protein
MPDQYLIVPDPPQVPAFDPEKMAQGLGHLLLTFLGPLMWELDRSVDKRLIRTFAHTIEAILTFRDQMRGLLLTELGGYLDRVEGGGGGTKRLSRLLHSPKWKAWLIEHFLWGRASQQVEQWQAQGQEGLVLWDGSVWEKPESLKSEGLCAVQSSKARRLTHVKPGYYNPPGKPICVPGLHWISLLVVGRQVSQGPTQVACMRWWTSRGPLASWVRDEELKLLRQAIKKWARAVIHVFDRGYASSVWLGALRGFAARFVLRWRHDYQLRDAQGNQKAAWKLVQGKRAWGSRPLWDAKRGKWITASVLAIAVFHPDHPGWPLWLVVARRQGGSPWYLLTSEKIETEEQAWAVVLAYARRWQIELSFKHCKSEFSFQSPRVWTWEERLKLLGLATLAYAFLLTLLSAEYRTLRCWLFRYGCHRTGRHLREARVPLARLRSALSKLWLAHPPALTRRAGIQL